MISFFFVLAFHLFGLIRVGFSGLVFLSQPVTAPAPALSPLSFGGFCFDKARRREGARAAEERKRFLMFMAIPGYSTARFRFLLPFLFVPRLPRLVPLVSRVPLGLVVPDLGKFWIHGSMVHLFLMLSVDPW